jgi:DNA topoisomerase-3
MKVLSVAEKPSVAKQLAQVINGGSEPNARMGVSKYNKNWDTQTQILNNQPCDMVITSVTGHVMDLDFGSECVRLWSGPAAGASVKGWPGD